MKVMVVAVVLTACSPLILLSILSILGHRNPDSNWNSTWWMRWSEAAVAWFLGLIFLSGGMSKLMPFPGVIGPVWLEEKLAPYGLGMFALFVAWSEAIIGLCLLAKPLRALGAVMLVPLILNILMVTVSMQWRGTPWVITFFLVANLFLLTFHFRRWQPLLDIGLNWLSTKSAARSNFYRLLVLLSGVLILSGPGLYGTNETLAVIVIVVGFVGLLLGEFVFRFRYLPEESGISFREEYRTPNKE